MCIRRSGLINSNFFVLLFILVGVTVDEFLDLFVVNMVSNCPKWDPTLVETKYLFSFSVQVFEFTLQEDSSFK